MSRKWTEINESMAATREADIEFTSDMSELDASLAISEAVSFAAEGKYIAEGLFKDILSFNKKAEEREYSTMEYISEAFSIGGVFKKIVDFMVKIWNTIVNFFKGLFTEGTSSSGGSTAEVKKVKEEINAAAEEIIENAKKIKNLKKADGRTSNVQRVSKEELDKRHAANLEAENAAKKKEKDDFYRQQDKDKRQADEEAKQKEADAIVARKANRAPQAIKAVKVNRTRSIYEQIEAIGTATNRIITGSSPDSLAEPCTIGKQIPGGANNESSDEVYSPAISALTSIISNILNTDKGGSKDLDEALKSMESLLSGTGKEAKTRVALNKDIAVRLNKDTSGILADAINTITQPTHKNFIKANASLFSGKNMKDIVKKIANHIEQESKKVTASEDIRSWVDYINIMCATSYTEMMVSRLDDSGKRASEIFDRVKAMQDTVSKLSTESNPDMSEQTVADFNGMSSKLTNYQTNIQEILTVGVSFCIQAMQRHLDTAVSEFNKLKAFMAKQAA